MAYDTNPLATDGDRFIAGKTAEQVARAIVDKSAPAGTTEALLARIIRKGDARAAKSDEAAA